ncbi:MAG: tetratricopeptide repeat protein [Tepidisphaerales bacterium]
MSIRSVLFAVACGVIVAARALGAAETPGEQMAQIERMIHGGQDAEATPRLRALQRELEAQVKADPANPANQFLLSKALYYLGEDDAGALAGATRAVELAPANAEYRVWKATILLAANEPAKAVAELREACRLAPERVEYTASLVSALAAAKQWEEAEKVLAGLMQREPKNGRWLGMQSDLRFQAGDGPGAEQWLRRAVEVDAAYYNGWYNLGQFAQNRNKPAEALPFFEKAAGLKPDELLPRAKIVQCLQALGRLGERDKAREDVFAVYAAGKTRELIFCRDQFEAGGKKVAVFEYFEPGGVRAVRYSFRVTDKSGQKIVETASLGSYEAITLLARQKHEIGPGERMYHIDHYYPGGHATYAMFKKEPPYDEVRKIVVEIFEGTREPLPPPEAPAKK